LPTSGRFGRAFHHSHQLRFLRNALICPTSKAQSEHASYAKIARRANLSQGGAVAENQNE
jgi:hypothetical protein